MSQTYQATGINLKTKPMGEADRLLTVLTPECGLVRVIAPGSRKHQSSLRGRSELFVVNQLLIVKGRSLAKIIQADTIKSYPGLSGNLTKLIAAQYLAELALNIALSEQPQEEIYRLINVHLSRIESYTSTDNIYAYLSQAIFHFLEIAGVLPQIYQCSLTQKKISLELSNLQLKFGFSFEFGGLIELPSLQSNAIKIDRTIDSLELFLLQNLNQQNLPDLTRLLAKLNINNRVVDNAWIKIEHLLREYTEYHLGCKIESASLMDRLFT
jgi:DNA repair protein RecO (recombination protein O)